MTNPSERAREPELLARACEVVRHHPECPGLNLGDPECTCGAVSFLADLEAHLKATFQPTEAERAAVRAMGEQKDMSDTAVIRHALRFYQMHDHRLRSGETCHYSGDAQRAAEFAGPLALTPTPVEAGSGELRDDDILVLAEAARKAICGQTVGFWVDPGAGSAMDRFQRDEPTPEQCADMARRGGHYELLYTGTSVEQMIIHVVRAAISALSRSPVTRDGVLEEAAKVAEEWETATARDIATAIRQLKDKG